MLFRICFRFSLIFWIAMVVSLMGILYGVAITLDFKHIDVNFRVPAPADSKVHHIGFSLEMGLA